MDPNFCGGLPSRVRVRCVAASGLSVGMEEVLIIPVGRQAYALRWTVADLLQAIRKRVRRVPAVDIQELELDIRAGGRMHENDLLEEVLQDGDALRASVPRVVTTAHSAPVPPLQPARPPRWAEHGPGPMPKAMLRRSAQWGVQGKEDPQLAAPMPVPPRPSVLLRAMQARATG